ncbi:MAG: N-acetyltransferase, partial [Chitinophagia bacterium]|nr:N-acetyltransferase [Chitinophagia bacterium]
YAPESLAAQMQDGHTFVLVEHDGLRIGFASFSELEPGLFKLHKLYLLPHTQGHGVGRNVLQQLCVMLRSTGGAQLTLNVNRFNIPAIGFYERNGFLCMGEEDIDIGEGYFMNDYLYTLTI